MGEGILETLDLGLALKVKVFNLAVLALYILMVVSILKPLLKKHIYHPQVHSDSRLKTRCGRTLQSGEKWIKNKSLVIV